MVKKFLDHIFVLIVSIFLSGCATLYNPATGKNEFIFINSDTEVAIGNSAAAQITKKHQILRDRILLDRIERIGRRIVKASDRKDIKYSFYVLADKELNAMTLPGGLIYINRGLMDILNDDELAYVIAHEVGHTAARHIAKKIQANMAYQLILTVAFAGSGLEGNNTQNIATGVDTIYNLIGLSYSRKDEYEADRLAVKYAFKAKFDPYASLKALEKIKEAEGPDWKIMKYFRTHPYVQDRIEYLREAIEQLNSGLNR